MDDLPSPMLSIQEKVPCLTPNNGCTKINDQELDSLLKSRFRLTETTSSLENRIDQLMSYFHSLSKIKAYYTVALERSHLEAIHFTWKDSFKPSKKHSHTTINSEKMTVVFNIGAVYSQIAAAENRGTAEGLTNAFRAFQNAAGAFRYLRETYEGGESVDVSRECVIMLETLMFAQVQECVFYQAVRARKSSTVCSMAARQIGQCYEEVQQALGTRPLNQHFERGWLAHVKLKASLFYAESCYHYSLHLHEKEEIGEQIVRLRMGLDHLRSTKRAVRGASSSLINVISRIDNKINERLKEAEKDNATIYYMRIPSSDSLNDLRTYTPERPKPLASLVALDNADAVCQT